MKNKPLPVSEAFKKTAVKSVFSILLFLGTYLFLILMAFALITLCALAGYWLVTLQAMFATVMLALGLVSLGFLILFFLIKFIFSKDSIDRSHLIEVKENDQPELFKFIREIVDEVQTNFPKKIYVSSEVNAAVFYDSSFWSMFFPVKKNLQIGLGLLNSVSILEFKAILAHEFGHFSQRSMKVGSYVYHVNRVIYNMLYNNEAYNSMMQRWANVSSYFAIFVNMAAKIIAGIQAILKKVYTVVNLNYLALSREMEFHADAIAAHVAGSRPLISSLLRADLADHSLNTVLDHYSNKIAASEKTNNFYPQQSFVMNHLASLRKLPVENGLPQVTSAYYKKFNRSKLILKDQWSSHPSTEDRIAQLTILDQPDRLCAEGIATDLLINAAALQEQVTEKSFSAITFEKVPVDQDVNEFMEEYMLKQVQYAPEMYNGYFDYRGPYTDFEPDVFNYSSPIPEGGAELLFSDQIMDLVYTLDAAMADLTTLEDIYAGNTAIKTFDYDGQKYTSSNCYTLITHLKADIERLKEQLNHHDLKIFNHFHFMASVHSPERLETFKSLYLSYKELMTNSAEQQHAYVNLQNAVQFMHTSTPHTAIESYMLQVKRHEKEFKKQVEKIIGHEAYGQNESIQEIRENFEEYLSKDWKYYESRTYFEKEVELLFCTMDNFYYIIANTNFKLKMAILEFQEEVR